MIRITKFQSIEYQPGTAGAGHPAPRVKFTAIPAAREVRGNKSNATQAGARLWL